MSADVKSTAPKSGELEATPLPTTPLGSKEVHIQNSHLENVDADLQNLVYDDADHEPEIHARTYIALISVSLINIAQLVALQGPPSVLSYIAKDLNNPAQQIWISNALLVPQAALCPIVASFSDTFQVRKSLIIGLTGFAFIGAAIAPGSQTIYRLIGAQILIGFGLVTTPLAYVITSEILPRKWRPVAQGVVNISSCLGAICGPLAIGAFTRDDPADGWRKFYWMEMAVWGACAIGIYIGYKPPKRHTRYDHLSLYQKLRKLDVTGSCILIPGLTLTLTGLTLGGNPWPWTNVRVLTTLTIGLVTLVVFFVYEWKGTKTGIVHHEFFQRGKEGGRTFAICLGLMAIEGLILFGFVIFYPILTSSLFETDPFLLVARSMPLWVGGAVSTFFWGYLSTKLRNIREVLIAGCAVVTTALIGIATIQPGESTKLLVFAGILGLGFGCLIILVVSAIQLCLAHHVIATATAIIISTRSLSAAMFTAIFTAVMTNGLNTKIPNYVSKAAITAGLPSASVPAFVGALASGDTVALPQIPGVKPGIIAAGVAALQHAFADAIRPIFIICACFGAVACISCAFMSSLRDTMNYRVDAPVEDLHVKQHHHLARPKEHSTA